MLRVAGGGGVVPISLVGMRDPGDGPPFEFDRGISIEELCLGRGMRVAW